MSSAAKKALAKQTAKKAHPTKAKNGMTTFPSYAKKANKALQKAIATAQALGVINAINAAKAAKAFNKPVKAAAQTNVFGKKNDRPSFSDHKRRAAVLEARIATGDATLLSENLQNLDLASPHRLPFAKLRDFVMAANDRNDVAPLVVDLCAISEHHEHAFRHAAKAEPLLVELADLYEITRRNLETKFADYWDAFQKPWFGKAKEGLIMALNNLASNAPGLGPHLTANNPASDRKHLRSIAGLPVVNPNAIFSAPIGLGKTYAKEADEVFKSIPEDQKKAPLLSPRGGLSLRHLKTAPNSVPIAGTVVNGKLRTLCVTGRRTDLVAPKNLYQDVNTPKLGPNFQQTNYPADEVFGCLYVDKESRVFKQTTKGLEHIFK
jgi:hypothetical protein